MCDESIWRSWVVVWCLEYYNWFDYGIKIWAKSPTNGSETFDQFDVELHLLKKNTQQEVVKVIKVFLRFLKLFDSHQIHNMFALMLDPHFKSLEVF